MHLLEGGLTAGNINPLAYIKLDEKIVAVVAELQDNQIPLLGGFLMFMMLLNIPFL